MARAAINILTGKLGDLPSYCLPNGKRIGDATLNEIESAAKDYHAQIQGLLREARRTRDARHVHQAQVLYSEASRLFAVALMLEKWHPAKQ